MLFAPERERSFGDELVRRRGHDIWPEHQHADPAAEAEALLETTRSCSI